MTQHPISSLGEHQGRRLAESIPDTPPPAGPQPDASRAAADTPIRHLISLVHRLIAFGRNAARDVQQSSAAGENTPAFGWAVLPFGTSNVTLILWRITRGLRRAIALEAFLSQRAARGKIDAACPDIRLPLSRRPRAADAAARPQARPAKDPVECEHPTSEELAAELRRRPVGAVIADICRDIGIRPGDLEDGLWQELTVAIARCGGNLIDFQTRLRERSYGPAALAAWALIEPVGPREAGGPALRIVPSPDAARARPP